MTITAAATATPLPKISAGLQFVDENGRLTQYAAQCLTQWREYIVGANRVVPCNASGTNVVELTPLDSGPLIEKYVDHEIFVFNAANTSTGDVTATVVPRTGTLATLKVYVDDGATQATTGDVIQNCIYLAIYASHLDGGLGGLVLK